MQIKKFYAANLPAAMRDVRKTLGPDAVIMSTRYLDTNDSAVITGGGKARVEITAARELPDAMPTAALFDREIPITNGTHVAHTLPLKETPAPRQKTAFSPQTISTPKTSAAPAKPAPENAPAPRRDATEKRPASLRELVRNQAPSPLLNRYLETAASSAPSDDKPLAARTAGAKGPKTAAAPSTAPTVASKTSTAPDAPAVPAPEKFEPTPSAKPSAKPSAIPQPKSEKPPRPMMDLRTLIKIRNAANPFKKSKPVRALAPNEEEVTPFVPPTLAEAISASNTAPATPAPAATAETTSRASLTPTPPQPLRAGGAVFRGPVTIKKSNYPLAARLRLDPDSSISAAALETACLNQGVDPVLVHRILARLFFNGTRHEFAPYDAAKPLKPAKDARCSFEKFVKTIEAFTPAPEDAPLPGQTRRIALVGPTGVGKTTTIAKIASLHALHLGKQVAIISLDTYRIAAAEQIKTYAKILSVPIAIATNPAEFTAALDRFENADLILIDTPGCGPRDAAAIRSLGNMLKSTPGIETHLVLPAGLRAEETRLALEGFEPTRYGQLLFSKLDEAVHWGPLLNTWIFAGHTVSYFTMGQRVPEDLETARMEYLCDTLLAAKLPVAHAA